MSKTIHSVGKVSIVRANAVSLQVAVQKVAANYDTGSTPPEVLKLNADSKTKLKPAETDVLRNWLRASGVSEIPNFPVRGKTYIESQE